MEINITEEEFKAKKRLISSEDLTSLHEEDAIRALKELGITFKKEIDWGAETHDPSVIPKNWLVERWDDGDYYRRVGLIDKNYSYSYHSNYRAIKKENWPKWAIERHKSLED